MIRHRPHGSGHPYATTNDQRVPAAPVAGERVELRVRAAPSVQTVLCEWSADNAEATMLELVPVESAVATAVGGGHLAAAQARAVGGGGSWVVLTPALRTGRRYSYRFHAATADGRRRTTRWYELTAARWTETGGALNVKGRDRMIAGSVRWLIDQDHVLRVRFDLPLAAADHVVGFGERYDSVDQRGRRLDAVVFEQYKAQSRHGRSYLPMPFALVVGAAGSWGFHVATARRTWFDVGVSMPDRLRVEAEVGADGKLTVRLYDGDPAEVLRGFLRDVGQPTELPPWVFRPWASGNEWNTQARILAEMGRHRDTDIPVGVVVIEAWSDESTFAVFRGARYDVHEDGAPHRLADFTFPPDGPWPDPRGLVDELHARGIKVVLWQVPLLKMRPHPSGQARADARVAVDRGLVVREASGRPYRNRGWWFPLALLPDFTSEEAREWWMAKRRYLVDEVGVDGFKTDGGEHAWGHDLRYADGRSGADGNNTFPVHYAHTYGDLLRSCGKAPVTFSRAGFTGSQPHGAFWAGDQDSTWEAFRSSLIAGITASACGIVYWGWDLAGFSGDMPDAELYLRAAGAACFMPIMQYHSEFNHHRQPSRDRTPWNIADRTDDERVLPAFRRFAHLRDRLVPYLAEQARAAVGGGPPLMRGLFFVDPADPVIWRYPLQFQLGDALLVVPVVEPGVEEVAAFVPSGHWVDVWTGTGHRGPAEITLPAPIHRPPVLCRVEMWPNFAPVFTDLPVIDRERSVTSGGTLSI